MRVRRGLTRRIKNTEKAIAKTEQAFLEAQQWQAARHRADLLKSVYHTLQEGIHSCTAFDWEENMNPVTIEIDSQISPAEFMQQLYSKAEKLRKGEIPLQKQMARLKQQLQTLQLELERFSLADPTVPPKSPPSIMKKSQKLPYRRFFSSTGHEIWVGKDAESNHLLTFRISRKSDLWLHVGGEGGAPIGGSHVIIPLRNHSLDEVTLHEAALLAAYYSKKRSMGDKVEVHYTERANLYRLKQMPKGRVALRKYKSYTVQLDKEQITQILGRAVIN